MYFLSVYIQMRNECDSVLQKHADRFYFKYKYRNWLFSIYT